MPPKVKITRENIISAAVDLVREQGEEAINARTVAAALGCSTQPIFSNFSTMEELRLAVVKRAEEISLAYVRSETEAGKYPPYKSSGMAYIRFAAEEGELFKLLYMRKRSKAETDSSSLQFETAVEQVGRYTGLDRDEATRFHLELWALVHGIASMQVTSFLSLPEELVSNMMTDVFLGLKKQYGVE